MTMGVYKSRQKRSTFKVDDLCCFALSRQHVSLRADKKNAAILDGDGLRAHGGIIHGENWTADSDLVGSAGESRLGCKRENYDANSNRSDHGNSVKHV